MRRDVTGSVGRYLFWFLQQAQQVIEKERNTIKSTVITELDAADVYLRSLK